MFNVTIKHDNLDGGEQHWTVPFRPLYEALRDEDAFAVLFPDVDPDDPEAKAGLVDWIVLPKQGFGYVRAKLLVK